MGLYVGIAVALCLVQISLLRWTGIRWYQIFGVVLSLSWALALSLSWWNPLGWYVASDQTLNLMSFALAALSAGSILPLLVHRETNNEVTGVAGLRNLPLARSAAFLTILGLPLLLLFIVQVVIPSGISSETLQIIRLNANGGLTSVGFYYFYPFQLAAALWWISWCRDRNRMHLVAALIVTLSLTLTSGRTNILFVIAWLGFASALSPASWKRGPRLPLASMLVLIVSGLALFTALGNAVGKTFQNSALSRSILDANNIPDWLVQPIYYFGGAIAGLSYKLDQTAAPEGWSQALLPAAKISAAILGLPSPDDIQGYVFMPYPTNVFSGMGPFLMAGDTPWEGLIGLFILGLIAGFAFRSWRAAPDPLSILIYGMVLAGAASFPFDNLFAKPFFWLYLIVLALLRSYWRRLDNDPRDHHDGTDLRKDETPNTHSATAKRRIGP